MVRQLYLYSIEAADFPDSVTSENTLREFPLVIATVAKVSRKRGLWLVVRVNKKPAPPFPDPAKVKCWFPISFLNLFCDLERPVDRGGKVIAAENDYGHRVTPRLSRRGCCAGINFPFAGKA